MGNVKKLRTQIKGLDDVFYGGINVDDSRQEGTLIAIYGSKGVNKIQLAMQIVRGLTDSLLKECRNRECGNSLFYSINKRTNEMLLMLTNIMIYNEINNVIWSYRQCGNNEHSFEPLKKYFDLMDDQESPYSQVVNLFNSNPDEFLFFLSDGSVYYNERTNSLNIQQVEENDSRINQLLRLKDDTLKSNPNGEKSKLLCNIEFYGKDDLERGENEIKTESMIAPQYLSSINSVLGRLGERYNNGNCPKVPCIAIDGFSQLSEEELKRVPLAYIEGLLRRMSHVSILVFDDKCKAIGCNADIVIDMTRRDVLDKASFSYSELQVTKCLPQLFAPGRHQYKLTHIGIEVYPNTERVLNRKNFDNRLYCDVNRSMFMPSYRDYIQYLQQQDKNVSNSIGASLLQNGNSCITTWESFRNVQEQYLRNLVNNRHSSNNEDHFTLLENILFRNEVEECANFEDANLTNIITTLVGKGYEDTTYNYFANAVVFNKACQKQETLYVVFAKDGDQVRTNVSCPCLRKRGCCDICIDCHKRLHLFTVRMGDISAAELLYRLDEVLNYYNTDNSKHKISQIVVDEIQTAVEFAFPSLFEDRLFLPALIRLFRRHRIPTLIMCQKNKKYASELCSFADNVIMLNRYNSSDDDHEPQERLDILIPKYYCSEPFNRHFEYTIPLDEKAKSGLFVCEMHGIKMNPDYIGVPKEIPAIRVESFLKEQ